MSAVKMVRVTPKHLLNCAQIEHAEIQEVPFAWVIDVDFVSGKTQQISFDTADEAEAALNKIHSA